MFGEGAHRFCVVHFCHNLVEDLYTDDTMFHGALCACVRACVRACMHVCVCVHECM